MSDGDQSSPDHKQQQQGGRSVLEWDPENESYRKRIESTESDYLAPIRRPSLTTLATEDVHNQLSEVPGGSVLPSPNAGGERKHQTTLVYNESTEQYQKKVDASTHDDFFNELREDAQRSLQQRRLTSFASQDSDFLPAYSPPPSSSPRNNNVDGASTFSSMINSNIVPSTNNGTKLPTRTNNPQINRNPSSQQEDDFLVEASRRLFGLPHRRSRVEIRLEARVSPMTNCLRRFYRNYMFESIWLILILIGILMSILAWCIDELTERLFEIRDAIGKLPKINSNQHREGLEKWLFDQPPTAAFFIWWAWALTFGFGSILVVKYVAPQAAGSGIEQVRSIMTGYPIPGYLEINTLVAKVIGLVCVQASGLTVGKEGPFVHIACSLANLLLSLPLFHEIKQSRALTKQVISAACATGVSSTFGAPVGGVLFAIEVTSNVYHTSDYWKAFFCAVCGEVIFRELSYFGTARASQISLFPTTFPAQPYLLIELPGFIFLAAIGGLYGGLYVKIIMGVRSMRTRILSKATAYRNERKKRNYGTVEPGGGSTVPLDEEEIGTRSQEDNTDSPLVSRLNRISNILNDLYLRAMYFLLQPMMYAFSVITITALLNWFTGQFMKRTLYSGIEDLVVSGEMAQDDILGVSADHRLHSTDWGTPSLLFNLIMYFFLKSFLCAIALSLPVPTGTLIPMLAIGLAFGRVGGEIAQMLFGAQFIPGGYALVGASAFIAGATGAISTAVIIFEITSQLAYMVPILVAVIVGRAAGKLLSPDYYEALQIMKKLPNIPPLSHQSSYNMLIVEIMNPNNIPMLPRFSTLHDVEIALNNRYYSEVQDDDLFAVVDSDTNYLSAIPRHILRNMLQIQSAASSVGIESTERFDLTSIVTPYSIAPSVPMTTTTIDCLQVFELTLSPALFVTDRCKVVGWMDLPTFRHRIEHGDL